MIVIIVLAIVLVAGMGVVAFTKMSGKKGNGKAPVEKKELTAWKMEEFVVNLADANESRYLKVNLVLEVEGMPKEKGGEGGEGGEGQSPEEAKARDAIITVLTKKHYNELLSEEGKNKLKESLKSELDKALKEKKIKVEDVYFTSFAMQ